MRISKGTKGKSFMLSASDHLEMLHSEDPPTGQWAPSKPQVLSPCNSHSTARSLCMLPVHLRELTPDGKTMCMSYCATFWNTKERILIANPFKYRNQGRHKKNQGNKTATYLRPNRFNRHIEHSIQHHENTFFPSAHITLSKDRSYDRTQNKSYQI